MKSEIQQELDRWQNVDFQPEHVDRSSYQSDNRMIVVGGCGRSGTTLLRVMLDSHPEIACGPESLLFLPVPIDVADLSWKFEIPLQELEQHLVEAGSRTEFIDWFRERYLRVRQRRIWADKTGRNVHCFSDILCHFPNAKILHAVRDGRDVVCSLRTHRKRTVVDGKIVLTGNVMPWENCADRWVNAVCDGIACRGLSNYMEVKYENIVQQTESTLKQLCHFLEIPYSKKMIDYHKITGPSRDVLKFPQNVEATQPLYNSQVGRWHRDISKAHLKKIMPVLAPTLLWLGYSL